MIEVSKIFRVSFFVLFCQVFLIYLPSFVNAQEIEIVGFHTEEVEAATIKNPEAVTNDKNKQVALEDLKIGVRTNTAKLGLPIMFHDKKYVLVNALSYKEVRLNYNNIQTTESQPNIDVLYTRKFQVTFVTQFSSLSQLILLGAVSRSSDETAALSKSQKYTGGVLYNGGEHKNFRYGGGIISSYSFGEQLYIPILSLKYVNGPLYIKAFLPTNFLIDYEISEYLRPGFEVNIDGDQFRIYEEAVKSDIVKYSRGTYGLYLLGGKHSGLQFKIGLGKTFLRRFQGYADGEKIYDLELNNSTYYRAIVKLSF